LVDIPPDTLDLLNTSSEIARLRAVRRLLCLTGDLPCDSKKRRALRGWIDSTDDLESYLCSVRTKALSTLEELLSSESDTARQLAVKTIEDVDQLHLERLQSGWSRESVIAIMDADFDY